MFQLKRVKVCSNTELQVAQLESQPLPPLSTPLPLPVLAPQQRVDIASFMVIVLGGRSSNSSSRRGASFLFAALLRSNSRNCSQVAGRGMTPAPHSPACHAALPAEIVGQAA